MLLCLLLAVAVVFSVGTERSADSSSPAYSIYEPFHQKDYVIEMERMEVIRFDRAYLSEAKIKSFKFNRTYTAINTTFTILQDIQDGLVGNIQTYKFQSNEYREFPLSFEGNVCKGLNSNAFGVENIFKCGNISRCPLRKGTHRICNWGPDYSKYPPYIPTGRYKVAFTLSWNSRFLVSTEACIAIKSVKWDFG